VPCADSFGHDVETTYLIIESMKLLEIEDKEKMKIAKKLLDHSLIFGLDKKNGALNDVGTAFGRMYKTEKIWWVQAEFLNSLLLLSTYYPDDPNLYYSRFLRQWEFVKNNLIDQKYGGWLIDDSEERRKNNKGSCWKTPYHSSRALINGLEYLENDDGE